VKACAVSEDAASSSKREPAWNFMMDVLSKSSLIVVRNAIVRQENIVSAK